MSPSYSGNYPIETRDGEVERLHIQGESMAPETDRMLDLMGVSEGWSCLDIGCGPRGITDLLSRRVGPSGRVVGLDMNASFIEYARTNAAENTEFVIGDAYSPGLAQESFDLVHMRFVASTAGEPERLIEEALKLVRPGGVVALQEPDGSTLNCYPPHAAWDRLKDAVIGAFSGVGSDVQLARRLYFVARQAGLRDVEFRSFILGVRSEDPMVDYLPSTAESLRGTITRLGLLDETELSSLLIECREHLRRPDTAFTLFTVAQVWGRKTT
jgi:SAM-dependent methyltransferase